MEALERPHLPSPAGLAGTAKRNGACEAEAAPHSAAVGTQRAAVPVGLCLYEEEADLPASAKAAPTVLAELYLNFFQ